MVNKIQFKYKDSDPFLEIITNYEPKIGDTVYYELKGSESNYQDIRYLINGNFDLEGVISKKWVNLSDGYILWTALLD
jgi:hypothetical protein